MACKYWSSAPRPGAAVRARVLVVEDEPTLREAIAAYLKDAGFGVDQAENGVQALDKMRQTRPDVVVLDLLLPIMNAYELVPRMRSQPALAPIPVILLSAAQDLPTATEQLQPRASLAKPVDLDVLLAVVARVASS
jgi:DNA-binding response OmpR family regulator